MTLYQINQNSYFGYFEILSLFFEILFLFPIIVFESIIFFPSIVLEYYFISYYTHIMPKV